jgi:hypothetical protein
MFIAGFHNVRTSSRFLALVVLAVGVLTAASPATAAVAGGLAPGTGRLSVVFRPAKTKAGRAGRAVWDDGFLQHAVAKLNARLTLPKNVKIIVRPGSSLDADTVRGHPTILGYANPRQIRPIFTDWGILTRSGRRVHPGNTPGGRRLIAYQTRQLMRGVAMHEVGHVYTEQWPIPTTTDNEGIADLFSGWVTVKLMHDPRALLALANYRLGLTYFFGLQHNPGQAAWERAQGYVDLARLVAARPGWLPAMRKLVPKGYFHEANFSSFVGGPWAGLEDALQPIAIRRLGG